MSTIEELYAQRQAMMRDPRPAAAAAARNTRTEAIVTDLAQRNHADVVERYQALERERTEVGADLQETRHQLAALDQVRVAPGDEDAHDERAGLLAARERRLTRQAQQMDAALAQLGDQLRTLVARDAAQLAKQWKREHNRLVREMHAKQAALLEQMKAVEREYGEPIGAVRQELIALSAIVSIDLASTADGTLREQ